MQKIIFFFFILEVFPFGQVKTLRTILNIEYLFYKFSQVYLKVLSKCEMVPNTIPQIS